YEIMPQEYRIRHTMIYAMKLICKSDLVISDIADECGFKYLSHFSALFKKTHGLTPHEALKRFRYHQPSR
ncbi:MAG: helix-turn-helix domain-containing protein, partial [Victivallales bacterium]|nr:helix-turn-helix domain-containing protein [Victivallales bacterium]